MRARVVEHPSRRRRDPLGVVERARRRVGEERLVRHRAPEEVREPRGALVAGERDDRHRAIERRPAELDAVEEERRLERGGDDEAEPVVVASRRDALVVHREEARQRAVLDLAAIGTARERADAVLDARAIVGAAVGEHAAARHGALGEGLGGVHVELDVERGDRRAEVEPEGVLVRWEGACRVRVVAEEIADRVVVLTARQAAERRRRAGVDGARGRIGRVGRVGRVRWAGWIRVVDHADAAREQRDDSEEGGARGARGAHPPWKSNARATRGARDTAMISTRRAHSTPHPRVARFRRRASGARRLNAHGSR